MKNTFFLSLKVNKIHEWVWWNKFQCDYKTLVESVIHSCIYLHKEKILNEKHFGFQSGHSTNHTTPVCWSDLPSFLRIKILHLDVYCDFFRYTWAPPSNKRRTFGYPLWNKHLRLPLISASPLNRNSTSTCDAD